MAVLKSSSSAQLGRDQVRAIFTKVVFDLESAYALNSFSALALDQLNFFSSPLQLQDLPEFSGKAHVLISNSNPNPFAW